MLGKGSTYYSVFHNKCPRCQQGEFFEHECTLNFKKNLKIYETCDHCGLKYMIEPSFFYGAMYVSYALTVAFAVAIFVLSYLMGLSLLITVAAIVVVLVAMIPFTMRVSRLLYINMFVHYQEKFD